MIQRLGAARSSPPSHDDSYLLLVRDARHDGDRCRGRSMSRMEIGEKMIKWRTGDQVLPNRVFWKTTNSRFCQHAISWLCGNPSLFNRVLVAAPKQDFWLLHSYLGMRKTGSAKNQYPNKPYVWHLGPCKSMQMWSKHIFDRTPC
jgi:hypothetical protein